MTREARNARIEALYRAGYSLSAVGKKAALCHRSVLYILRARGVPIPNRGQCRVWSRAQRKAWIAAQSQPANPVDTVRLATTAGPTDAQIKPVNLPMWTTAEVKSDPMAKALDFAREQIAAWERVRDAINTVGVSYAFTIPNWKDLTTRTDTSSTITNRKDD